MTFKQIQDLIKLVSKSEIGELKIEEENFKISLKSKECFNKSVSVQQAAPMVQAAAPAPASTPAPAAEAEKAAPAKTDEKSESGADTAGDDGNYITVKSPMIGTFYRSSSPEKPPFVKVGDTVSKGQVTCIVEAMKLFNEIESEVEGKVVKILVDDASPVEYDQALFLIDPS